ncbi:MAG TPA: hypothetical protein VGR32_03170 [Brevundimonas sp.]|jgi:hypothetical protein|uniref:hypothetical protein n=1 Tax=Brevundimonas sp. TaxID=1871086 RepID=UPI002DF3039B|nr:hypothetical protein [Brevundimonas sp.]
MTDDRRDADRRARDRRASGRALVPVDAPPTSAQPPTPSQVDADPAFSAQLLGQDGQRRGLKGGPPVLDAARSGYMKAQHSGPAERRPQPGRVTRSDV